MSQPMTFQELVDVMKFVAANNSPFSRANRAVPCIKYMYPSIDFRMNNVFAVSFSGFGSGDKVFHCQNECRAMERSLKERIMAYLTGQELIEDQALNQVGDATRIALEGNVEFYWVSTHNRAQYVK